MPGNYEYPCIYMFRTKFACMSACMHVLETIHLRFHMRMCVCMCIWKFVFVCVCVYVCTLVRFRTSTCGPLSGISYASQDGRFYFDLYVVIGPSSVVAKLQLFVDCSIAEKTATDFSFCL